MKLEDSKKRAKILYKKMQKEEDIDADVCNYYVSEIEELKEDLEDTGYHWIEKLDELDEMSEGMFGNSEDEIAQEFENAERQLGKILMKLGIDTEDSSVVQNSPGINIHLNNSSYQSQNQSQHQSQNLNIRELEEELEEELSKERPSESRVKKTIGNIIEVAKNSASGIISGVILRILG